jgi:hypothetical protein
MVHQMMYSSNNVDGVIDGGIGYQEVIPPFYQNISSIVCRLYNLMLFPELDVELGSTAHTYLDGTSSITSQYLVFHQGISCVKKHMP